MGCALRARTSAIRCRVLGLIISIGGNHVFVDWHASLIHHVGRRESTLTYLIRLGRILVAVAGVDWCHTISKSWYDFLPTMHGVEAIGRQSLNDMRI